MGIGSSVVHRLLARRRQAVVDLGQTDLEASDNLIELAKDRALRHVLLEERISCVVDVGAGVGDFGTKVRSLGYMRRIVSFELGPSLFDVLTQTAVRDHNWHVHQMGLGAPSPVGVSPSGDTLDAMFPSIIERLGAPPKVLLRLDAASFGRGAPNGGIERCLPNTFALLVETPAVWSMDPWGLVGVFPWARDRRSRAVAGFDCLLTRSGGRS